MIITIPAIKDYSIMIVTYLAFYSSYMYFLNNFKLKKIWLIIAASILTLLSNDLFDGRYEEGKVIVMAVAIFFVNNHWSFRAKFSTYIQAIISWTTTFIFTVLTITVITPLAIKLFHLHDYGVLENDEFTWGVVIFCIIVQPILILLMTLIIKKVIQLQRRIIPKRVIYFLSMVLIILAIIAGVLNNSVNNDLFVPFRDVWIIGLMIIVISCILFFALAAYMNATLKEQRYRNELQSQKNLEMYMKNLEQNYDEVRKFRHDIKNVLLALSSQIKETGNNDLINNTDKLLKKYNFDSVMNTDLDKFYSIKNSLIKGLVFGKYLEAQDRKIDFKLESDKQVLYPDQQYFDEFRILGIILDNAIEAAQLTEQPQVTLSISEDSDNLTMMVVNNYQGTINVANVFEDGYTTKGENRGLGLTMVKEIMKDNSNILINVQAKNNKFTAILTSNKKG